MTSIHTLMFLLRRVWILQILSKQLMQDRVLDHIWFDIFFKQWCYIHKEFDRTILKAANLRF